jgi:hypothetical protein
MTNEIAAEKRGKNAVLVTPPDLGHAITLHAIINKNPQIFNVNNSIKWKNCQASVAFEIKEDL